MKDNLHFASASHRQHLRASLTKPYLTQQSTPTKLNPAPLLCFPRAFCAPIGSLARPLFSVGFSQFAVVGARVSQSHAEDVPDGVFGRTSRAGAPLRGRRRRPEEELLGVRVPLQVRLLQEDGALHAPGPGRGAQDSSADYAAVSNRGDNGDLVLCASAAGKLRKGRKGKKNVTPFSISLASPLWETKEIKEADIYIPPFYFISKKLSFFKPTEPCLKQTKVNNNLFLCIVAAMKSHKKVLNGQPVVLRMLSRYGKYLWMSEVCLL